MRPGVPEFPQAHCLRVWVDLERRGEEEEEMGEGGGKRSLSLSLSLLLVYLLIYLCFSFPFTAEQSVRTAADEIPIYTSHSGIYIYKKYNLPPTTYYHLLILLLPGKNNDKKQTTIISPKPPFPSTSYSLHLP